MEDSNLPQLAEATLDSVDALEIAGDLVRGVAEDGVGSLVRETVPLEPEDLNALKASGPAWTSQPLQFIRAHHHAIALKIALGERPRHISAALGVSLNSIYILQKDEQFEELVESYRERMVERALDHSEQMSMVGMEAFRRIHERLIDDEAALDIPVEALRRIGETCVDRIGHSPVRRSESVNRHEHTLSIEKVNEIKRRHADPAAHVRGVGSDACAAETNTQVTQSLQTPQRLSDLFRTAPVEEAVVSPDDGEAV